MHHARGIKSRFLLIGIASLASLGALSCGGGHHRATVVGVTLREFTVTPDRSSAPRGPITFDVTNAGTEDHEFLVIQTNLAPDALPVEANGSYEENGPGTVLLAEIDVIPPNQARTLTLDLQAGNYVLICNRVEGLEAHYALGMHAGFSVD
jgi:hypothetical protein